MKKIIALVITLSLVITMLASVNVFASNSEITLTDVGIGYSIATNKIANVTFADSDDGVYILNCNDSAKSTWHPVLGLYPTNFYSSAGAANETKYTNARYLKVSYVINSLIESYDTPLINVMYRSGEKAVASYNHQVTNYAIPPSISANSYANETNKSPKSFKMTYIVDFNDQASATDNDIYLFMDDVLVAAYVDTPLVYGSYNSLVGCSVRLGKVAQNGDICKLSNIIIEAYDSSATFDEMGVKIGMIGTNGTKTMFNSGFYHSFFNGASADGKTPTIYANGGTDETFDIIVAGYDAKGALVGTKKPFDGSIKYTRNFDISSIAGAETYKVFFFDKVSLKPVILCGTAKDVRTTN